MHLGGRSLLRRLALGFFLTLYTPAAPQLNAAHEAGLEAARQHIWQEANTTNQELSQVGSPRWRALAGCRAAVLSSKYARQTRLRACPGCGS